MIHGLYINLDHRTDRRSHIETQFSDISDQIHIDRFSAIHHPHGAVGCSRSHIECLKIAIQHQWDCLLILEDDFELFGSASDFLHIIKDHMTKKWDVLLLSGFVRNRHPIIQNGLSRIIESQSTIAYIVRKHYYPTLLQNFKEGLQSLEHSGKAGEPTYALDQYWKRLQKNDIWYICAPILGKQSSGYSDIVGRSVNYDDYFLTSSWNHDLAPLATVTNKGIS